MMAGLGVWRKGEPIQHSQAQAKLPAHHTVGKSVAAMTIITIS